MADKRYILKKEVAAQKMQRMALEIAEQLDGDTADLIIIGVKNSGMVIAEKIGALLQQHVHFSIRIIGLSLDKHAPQNIELTEPTIDFNGKNVIITDDVSNSGRVLLYALKPLLAFYPKRIQTLVLVERMHKAFPVKSDYIGLTIATALEDHIQVEVENGEVIGAFI